jgi:hypothetical protein
LKKKIEKGANEEDQAGKKKRKEHPRSFVFWGGEELHWATFFSRLIIVSVLLTCCFRHDVAVTLGAALGSDRGRGWSRML